MPKPLLQISIMMPWDSVMLAWLPPLLPPESRGQDVRACQDVAAFRDAASRPGRGLSSGGKCPANGVRGHNTPTAGGPN